MPQEIVDRVQAIAEPIVAGEGMELVDIEYRRETRGWVLRLYIDKDKGVSLDDCVRISQEIGRGLDVEDLIPAPYTLEVSSPGLNRPLKREADFIKYRERKIRVKTIDPIGNRRQFKGRLLDVSDQRIEMETEQGTVWIPLSNIAKANLEIDL